LEKELPKELKLSFEQGELVAVDGERAEPIANIQKLTEIASKYAIGRDIHVGDTIIGIKGRVGFEAAAPLIIIKAHQLLEKHTLGKWQQFQKEQLGNFYGMLLHEGNYLDPVMRNIEAFLRDSQNYVSGVVFLTLHPYRFVLDGVSSPNDLMNASFGSYGEENRAWTAQDAKGFIKILSNPGKIANQIHRDHD
jgi:argininosuccinate synthase